MDKICRLMKKDSKGFTLVELMVVMLIIGILVAIAIPVYNKTQDNAKLRACQSNLRTIDGAVAQYIAETGEEPTGTGDISIDFLVDEGYLKEAPKCGSEAYTISKDADTDRWSAKCNNSDFTNHSY